MTVLLALLKGAALSLILPRASSLAAAPPRRWQALLTSVLSCYRGNPATSTEVDVGRS